MNAPVFWVFFFVRLNVCLFIARLRFRRIGFRQVQRPLQATGIRQ